MQPEKGRGGGGAGRGAAPPAPGAPLTQSETVAGFWWCHPTSTRCTCPHSQLSEGVPSLPLNLLEDTCWHWGCVSFRPGAGHPMWESSAFLLLKSSTQHSGKLFPSAHVICRENTAKAIEGISFVRSGHASLDVGTLLGAGRR